MKILVFNCGSSSLKYKLFKMPDNKELAAGEAQRIGPPTAEPSRIVYRFEGGDFQTKYVPMRNHAEALQEAMRILKEKSEYSPNAIAHRLVHGGDFIKHNTLVGTTELQILEKVRKLAPIHNPPAIETINACAKYFSGIPQAVVSDTAFHSTIPPVAASYALPKKHKKTERFRKYGFHGISHEYVVSEAADFLKIPLSSFNCVSCHLGSGGASLCAVQGGKSIDNTMGYSPLPGLIMSTRCGDLDPGFVMRLLSEYNFDVGAVEGLLNRKSGVLGLSGKSADIRDIIKNASKEGHSRDLLAMQIYLWRLKKYLGAYLAIAGGAHAVIFTDTIGESVPEVRSIVCAEMSIFGLKIDEERNKKAALPICDISANDSAVRILVIATNEEISIARNAYKLLCA